MPTLCQLPPWNSTNTYLVNSIRTIWMLTSKTSRSNPARAIQRQMIVQLTYRLMMVTMVWNFKSTKQWEVLRKLQKSWISTKASSTPSSHVVFQVLPWMLGTASCKSMSSPIQKIWRNKIGKRPRSCKVLNTDVSRTLWIPCGAISTGEPSPSLKTSPLRTFQALPPDMEREQVCS